MIKLIASDMDGTLVSSDHAISEANSQAIKRAQNKGVEFIITTGRSFEDAHSQVVDAGIECNYLVMNGSELRNAQGEIVQSLYLENSVVKKIVAELMENNLFVELYTTGGSFSPSDEETCKDAVATKIINFHPEISYEEAYQSAKEHFLYKEINRIATVDELIDQDYKIGKIISFSAKRALIAQLRTELSKKYPVNATGSFDINLEITNPLADKGKAIMHYAANKGITLDEVMTIGDSYNDLGMLSDSFGYTVAMGNAIEAVKAQAKYLTDTNDANGVGKAIARFV